VAEGYQGVERCQRCFSSELYPEAIGCTELDWNIHFYVSAAPPLERKRHHFFDLSVCLCVCACMPGQRHSLTGLLLISSLLMKG